MPRQAALPAWLCVHILHHAGKATYRVPPVTSTLGLAGGMAQVQRMGSALRVCLQIQAAYKGAAFRSRALVQVRIRRFAPGKASALRRCAQGSVPVGTSRQRAAPRSQFVGAPRTDGLAFSPPPCTRREREAVVRLPTSVRSKVRARPNRSFNRRRHGRPPCPRGSVCISSATRARQPAASPRLPLR